MSATHRCDTGSARAWARHLLGYGLVAALVLAVCPWIGGETLSPAAVWSGQGGDLDRTLFLDLRLPRLLLGFLAGGSLALVGCVFQVLFRNPLATPYTLGVTGGGTLGAYLALSVPWLRGSLGPLSSVQLLALAGSLLVLGLIYLAATQARGLSMTTLLLAGVTLGIVCNALILLIRYVAEPDLLVAMDRWTLGRLDVVGLRALAGLWPLLLPGLGILALQVRALDALALGRDLALGQGVEVPRVQRACLLGGSLTTAAVVSLAGPIGFVGLIIPHLVRRLSGGAHRRLLPASFLAGGAFLVVSDTVARTVLAPSEIPVGVITALVGGPCFIGMLLRRRL